MGSIIEDQSPGKHASVHSLESIQSGDKHEELLKQDPIEESFRKFKHEVTQKEYIHFEENMVSLTCLAYHKEVKKKFLITKDT